MSINSVLILMILVFLTVIFFMFPAADHMTTGSITGSSSITDKSSITKVDTPVINESSTSNVSKLMPASYVDGIVNQTKKITGQTSHVKRVNFNDSAEIVKYNVESGKNVSINRVKLTDNNEVVARKLTGAVIKSGIVGSSDAIGIEDISAGILLL